MEQKYIPQPPKLTSPEIGHYQEAINDLLKSGAISECLPCEGQFLSNYFIIKKKNGSPRFILNLKSLNKFIKTEHFKLEDLRTTLKLIAKDYFMASLDLKNAYFLIPVNETYRKYLRFAWQGKIFEFNVLPFGLSTAPYVFTKLLKPVMSLLRSLGFMSTIYLDDICCIAPTYEECINNITQSRALLESLGFIVNEEKSCFTPDHRCTYLGFIIDTENFHVCLTDEKRQNILTELKKLSRLQRCTIRYFARVVGLLTSACPGVKYGWLYTKQLERCKYLALLQSGDYDKFMNIPAHLLPDINWWINSVDHTFNPIREDRYVLEIFSDASKTGWGVVCNGETANGQWSVEEASKHINLLELLAAYFGLRIFASKLSDCQILLRIDNTTAISYINRMGGVRFPHLNKLTKDIWQFCESRNIFIYASYISSQDNDIADAESRRSHPDTEWQLSKQAYSHIVDTFGSPKVDLFATRLNTKCPIYVSWRKDPGAFAVNAFTINWHNLSFYAFPPVAVIAKVLRKIISDRAQGILVAPYWPTQAWFPLYNKLLISDLIIFEPTDKILSSVSNSVTALPQLRLMAGKLSGKLLQGEVYRQTL